MLSEQDYNVSGIVGECAYCGSPDTHLVSRNVANGMYTGRCDACERFFATDTLDDCDDES